MSVSEREEDLQTGQLCVILKLITQGLKSFCVVAEFSRMKRSGIKKECNMDAICHHLYLFCLLF